MIPTISAAPAVPRPPGSEGGGQVNAAGRPSCSFCGQPIQDAARAYRRIIGWDKPRTSKGGGTHGVTLRENLNEWAHRECVDLVKSGIDPGIQASLL